MAPDFAMSVAGLGQTLTVTGMMAACLGLVIGPAAEWAGYRTLMLCGLVALVVAVFGTALAPSFPLLVLAQLVGAVGASTITPMSYAIAATRFTGPARNTAISRIYAASSGVNVVGLPTIAFIGDGAGWRWAFVTVGCMVAASLALALVALPRDTVDRSQPFRLTSVAAAYRPLLRHRAMRLTYASQFLRGVAWTGTLTYIGAYLVEEMDRSVRVAGLVWLVLNPGFLAGSLLVGGRLRRYEPRRTFMLTVATMGALIGLLFIVQPGLVASFAILFLLAFMGGIAEVTIATIIAAETPTQQGPTMSLHSSTLRFGTGTGALAGGVLLALGDYRALGVGQPLLAAGAAVTGWLSSRAAREALDTELGIASS
jgi:DHA1 family L-arabinose/isopropyl-beta-D-thiogalactopyranoside export protein-like MFS transporter